MVNRNSIFGTAINEMGLLDEEEEEVVQEPAAIPPGIAPPISGAPEGFQPVASPTSRDFVAPEDKIPEKIAPVPQFVDRVKENAAKGFGESFRREDTKNLREAEGIEIPGAALEAGFRIFSAPFFAAVGAAGQAAQEAGIVGNDADKKRFQRDLLAITTVSGARIPKVRAPSLVPKAPLRQRIDTAAQTVANNKEYSQAQSASVMKLHANAVANEKRQATRKANLENIKKADISEQHKAVLMKQQLEGAEGPVRRLENMTKQTVDPIQAEKIRAAEVEKAPPGMRTALHPKLMKDVTNIVNKMIDEKKLVFDPLLNPTDQMVEAIASGRMPDKVFHKLLRDNNLTSTQFSNQLLAANVRSSVSEAGRELARMSEVNKAMMRAMKRRGLSPNQQVDLLEVARAGRSAWDRTGNVIGRVHNIWRGALVSQQSTSSRNFLSQGARVGMDALHRGVENAMIGVENAGRHAIGANSVKGPNPIDALATVQAVLSPKQSKIFTDFVTKDRPTAKQRLFQRYMGDVKTAQTSLNNPGSPITEFLSNPSKAIKRTMAAQEPGLLGKVEGTIDLFNTVNRGQEWMFRRAVFSAELKRRMKSAGLDWEDIQRRNVANEIPQELVLDAVDHALDLTYAGNLPGNTYGKIMGAVGRIPVPLGFAPFTRFMHNLMKTTAEYSPLGFAKAVGTQSGRAKLGRRDLQDVSKAIVGSTLLGGAAMYRLSGAGGEKYYEIELPNGETIDARPFAPMPQYMFMGDFAKRMMRGEDLPTRDEWMEAMTGQRMVRPEFVKLIDQVSKAANDPDAWDKAGRMTKTWAAENLTGFMTWFKQFEVLYSQFSPEERLHRSRAGNEFKAPFTNVVPNTKQLLPERQSMTRGDTPRNVHPGLKFLTGIRVQEAKNLVEREVQKHHLSYREIAGNTLSSPEANDRYAEVAGPIIEKMVTETIKSEDYQNSLPRTQAVKLKKSLQMARALARRTMKKGSDQDREFVTRKKPRRTRLATRENIAAGREPTAAQKLINEQQRIAALPPTLKAMAKLQISPRRIYGDDLRVPGANEAFKKIADIELSKVVDNFVQSRSFAQVPDKARHKVLLRALKVAKSKARKQFRRKFPELQKKIREKRTRGKRTIPLRDRKAGVK